MTGWDSVLRTVDVANLSDEMADALVYGFFPIVRVLQIDRMQSRLQIM